MTIKIPRHISRQFIQSHPEWIFIYGQDLAQKGCFGQSWECVSEPNAYPIFTCSKMCRSSGFFQDSMMPQIMKKNTKQIADILKVANSKPIIPFPKIGEGHSRMNEFAPKSWRWLRQEIDKIAYKHIEIVYEQ